MRVRDAVEEDGELLGELADAPAEVMRNVVHDRTVRVAEREENGGEPGGHDNDGKPEGSQSAPGADEADQSDASGPDTDGSETPEIAGFVGFDAMPGTVRVTYLRGSRDARERLLEEPVRFARKEGMSVEVLVPEDEETTKEVVEAAGFNRVGTGPQFEGGRTYEYQLDPT